MLMDVRVTVQLYWKCSTFWSAGLVALLSKSLSHRSSTVLVPSRGTRMRPHLGRSGRIR